MKATALREMSVEELKSRENDLRAKLFELKIRHNTGVLDSSAELGNIKRALARVLTVRNEIERNSNQEA